MKFDQTLTPRAGTLSPISILETCKDVYKRLFAKVKMRLVNVYKRFEENMFIKNQAVEINEGVAAIEELAVTIKTQPSNSKQKKYEL